MKNQVNMTPPKETNKAQQRTIKKKETYKVSDKEFRTNLLKKFNELWENRDRQLNKIRTTIYEQKEKFDKEIAIIEKTKTNLRVEKFSEWTEEFDRVSKVDSNMQKKYHQSEG